MKRNGNISESGKMLILGIGILLILAIIVIVLVVRMKDDVRKRDAVVETLQQEIQRTVKDRRNLAVKRKMEGKLPGRRMRQIVKRKMAVCR